MSKFKFLNKKAAKVQLPSEPRPLEEVQSEYNQLAVRAGQAQYQLFVFKQEIQQLNQRMLEVNKEAAQRKKLDETKAAAEKAAETKTEEKA